MDFIFLKNFAFSRSIDPGVYSMHTQWFAALLRSSNCIHIVQEGVFFWPFISSISVQKGTFLAKTIENKQSMDAATCLQVFVIGDFVFAFLKVMNQIFETK